jgi:hypothetical protein
MVSQPELSRAGTNFIRQFSLNSCSQRNAIKKDSCNEQPVRRPAPKIRNYVNIEPRLLDNAFAPLMMREQDHI